MMSGPSTRGEANTVRETIALAVTGDEHIHCAACEERIARALRRLPGIRDVQASARTQRVAVTLDPAEVSPDQVRAKFEQLGYQVAPAGGAG